MNPSRDGGRRRGRPLDPALAATIRAAALKVLADVGYRGLTMDEVAMVAGVSKATIYRRWPSKVDLLVSVIDEASDATLVELDTGSLRDDLVALLGAMTDILTGPGGGVSRALLGVLDAEPALPGPARDWASATQRRRWPTPTGALRSPGGTPRSAWRPAGPLGGVRSRSG